MNGFAVNKLLRSFLCGKEEKNLRSAQTTRAILRGVTVEFGYFGVCMVTFLCILHLDNV